MQYRRIYLMAALAVAAVVALAALPAIAQHQAKHGHGTFEHGMFLGHMVERLALTEEQKTEFHNLVTAHHEAIQGSMEDSSNANEALHDRIFARDFDEGAIRDAFSQVAAIQADLMVAHADMLQQLRQILSDDQMVEFQQILEERLGTMDVSAMGFGHGGRHPH